MTEGTPTILDALRLLRLRFDCETLAPAVAPAFKGPLLRKAVEMWWASTWCPASSPCLDGCQHPGECTFSRLCQPVVDPNWPREERILIGTEPSPAYVLWDGDDDRVALPSLTPWGFELTLIGELALQQINGIVMAVRDGIAGRLDPTAYLSRQDFWYSRLRAVYARGCARERLLAVETGRPNLDARPYTLDEIALTHEHALAWAHSFTQPIHCVGLHFASPIKLKERHQWVTDGAFSAVMRAIVRRLRLLSVIYGAGEWAHSEWGPLLDLAETVRIEHAQLAWAGYLHNSYRGAHAVEGFLGQAWYASLHDLRPLLPALWLGQWLHIGKLYGEGFGRYVVEQVSP